MEITAQHSQLVSKIAAGDGHGENSSYFDGWKAYDSDPYHPTRNPKGIIQMGLAENQLCHDLMEDWLRRNPEASICTAEGASQFREVAIFQDYHGLPSFRKAIARFMEKVRGGRVAFDPDRIVMAGGATGAEEIIAFCLADPGDAFLVPTPYYPGFNRDLCWRTGARLLPVHCSSSNNFKITLEALESAYDEATENGIRVKGLIFANPSNPLGTSMDVETIRIILNFINDKKIHVVSDEVYAGTVFHHPQFTSIAEVLQNYSDCDRGLVHILYSLSKDLGLPGFRVGIVYSYNDAVVSAARRMSSFGLVSSQTQHLISSMLSDEEFTSKFLEESKKRLSTRRERFIVGLRKVGISCLESNAGLFCWMDLRHLLGQATEEELWRVILRDVKLNVSPGTSFRCMEPGWFRACFANIDDEAMEEALSRIRSFVAKEMDVEVKAKKKKRREVGLRLSLPRRLFDQEIIGASSCLMSPQSPLIHATT